MRLQCTAVKECSFSRVGIAPRVSPRMDARGGAHAVKQSRNPSRRWAMPSRFNSLFFPGKRFWRRNVETKEICVRGVGCMSSHAGRWFRD
ncbi:hypothetical protein LF1_01800 [Rubripirellula obstinata]|uniref:Uncharacterized protein n=1 Tax=Rubripirellula obstinata TaxID=406547 RepID=A0A5B1CBV0_9BACT|nr:hypothetical protein LF1_01800 [Rubripirellula obstinata]